MTAGMTLTRSRLTAILASLLLALCLLWLPGRPTPVGAATAPSPTYTAHPSATPTDTPTLTQTARLVVVTAIPTPPTPTDTAMPTGAYSGTVPLGGNNQGPGWNFGIFSLHWFDFLGNVGSGFVGWLINGVNGVVTAVAGVLTGVPRPDHWPALAGLVGWLQSVGLGAAGTFVVFGGVLYVRSTLPGGSAAGGIAAVSILQRAIEALILVPLAGWATSQLLDLCAAFSDTITGQFGQLSGATILIGLVQVFLGGGQSGAGLLALGASPLTILTGIASAVMYALIVLLRLSAVALLAWLVALGPLALATWPMGSRIAGRWFWNTTAVALWGAGWAAWLLVVHAAMTDISVPPELAPFVVLALLLFGYGIPRQVDNLLGSSSASGGSGLAGLAVGVGAAVASHGVGKALAPTLERVFPSRQKGGTP